MEIHLQTHSLAAPLSLGAPSPCLHPWALLLKQPACLGFAITFCEPKQSRELWGLESYLPVLLGFQRAATSPIELNFPLQLEFKYSNKFVLETLTAPLCHLQGNTLWVFFFLGDGDFFVLGVTD